MTETQRAAVEPGARRSWPMTAEAHEALSRELAHLHAEMLAPAPVDRDGVVARLPVRHTRERYDALQRVLAGAVVVDDRSAALIGRRVELTDDAGDVLEVALVLPGDGEPARGWVSADAPLGLALLGARAGQAVAVHAPSGPWTAHVRTVR